MKFKVTKSKQLSFDSNKVFRDFKKRIEHGGGLRKGKRKLIRPFDVTKAVHGVLRSSRAKGCFSMLKSANANKVAKIVYTYAEKNQIKIYKFANSGNHLHILLKASSKKRFQAYLRTITGLIARHVMGAKKGCAKGKFWDDLAYTKLISWGRQFKDTVNYVWRNALEGWGVIPPREQALNNTKLDFVAMYPE